MGEHRTRRRGDRPADLLGATEDELADTQDDIDTAKQQADDAAEKAADAQAQADAEAAQGRADLVTQCAKAYLGAFGMVFEGETVKAGADAARAELEKVSASCEGALSG